MNTITISKLDNVQVLLKGIDNVPAGHKIAIKDIARGQDIIKYGNPIGYASCNIKAGEHVHTHNCHTKLDDIVDYEYNPNFQPTIKQDSPYKLTGYVREDGRVGIRNDIWVVVTVGCMNSVAKKIVSDFNAIHKNAAFSITHPYGCSQIGQDFKDTHKVIRQIITHPNAGGVLVLGLGCENNQIESYDDIDSPRVKFLTAQKVDDEISEGLKILEELYAQSKTFKRQPINFSDITIGLKCGGSDGLSGITANPLLGRLSDKLAAFDTKIVMSEVPEMFGAEHILMNRCKDKETFDKCVSMINNFKNYFKSSSTPIYENPSPGNKAGGITTLEDKSFGCIQKSGTSAINEILNYAQKVKEPGVSLLYGPGNDLISTTNLAAAGANLVLFTTGCGTPFTAFVPCIKIATNTALADKKQAWIDYDAQNNPDESCLAQYIVDIINGKACKAENLNDKEISIFKSGIIL